MADFLSTFAVESSRGWGGYSHFWGPQAPKSGIFARRRRAFYEKSALFWKVARKSLNSSTKKFRKFWFTLGSISERCFKHIKKWSIWRTTPIPPIFGLFWLSTRYNCVFFARVGEVLPILRRGWGGVLPLLDLLRKVLKVCRVLESMLLN